MCGKGGLVGHIGVCVGGVGSAEVCVYVHWGVGRAGMYVCVCE